MEVSCWAGYIQWRGLYGKELWEPLNTTSTKMEAFTVLEELNPANNPTSEIASGSSLTQPVPAFGQ